ncbi:hypothetical protein Q3G72_031866 [Acer saccharum]|nr:hypothetical protein Q3G72_031866 [Acer saccharum]
MGGARSTGDEQPVSDPDDSENFFTFRVHHGGYWIQLSGYGMPFNIACDKDLLWFGDKVPQDRVVDLYVERIEPLQTIDGNEFIPSQQPESQVHSYGITDDDHNGAQAAEEGDGSEVFGDGPQVDGVGPEVFGDGPHVDGERAERDRKGKRVQVDPQSNADECGSGSEYEEGSENLSSLDGSEAEEDEGVQPRKFIKTRYHEFTPKCDMQNLVFRLGMEFGSADVFRKAVRAHAIKHRRLVKFKKNDRDKDRDRDRAVCKAECCKWFVFASWLGDHKTFKIKSLNDEHTCAMSFKNRFVSSKHIAEKYVGQWRENPDWNFVEMSQQVRTDVNVDVSIWQYYRARNAARGMIHGSVNEQYSKLWEYCAELMRMNPTSIVMMKCSEEAGVQNPVFQRLYICLGALKKGWKEGCRRILGLDGCFIKGFYTGQLLTAIGVDPNNQMYPVAYALVESECKDTWFCVKHFYNNFKSEHKGLLLKQILWGATKSTTEEGFNHYMERIRTESADAHRWLLEKDPGHWSRVFFKDTAMCDMLCNNMCEAFNASILKARDKPVITLMEMIRNYLMKRFERKRSEVEKWQHAIGPKVFKFVEKLKLESTICHSEYSGNSTFQVKGQADDQYVVDIERRTCACNKWQLIGIPCIHGMSALMSSNRDPIQFIDNSTRRKAFSGLTLL